MFAADDKSFEDYLGEYYNLECEDTVGDMKCRFPYREVPANDFGLSVDEVTPPRIRYDNLRMFIVSWNVCTWFDVSQLYITVEILMFLKFDNFKIFVLCLNLF